MSSDEGTNEQNILSKKGEIGNEMSHITGFPSFNVNTFPTEILILILSYTDTLTLKNIPLVCTKWNDLLKDDILWHSFFNSQFPYASNVFSSVTRSNKYKVELLYRSQLRYSFRRGRLLTHQFFIGNILTGSSILIDWNRNKLTMIDLPRETIVTCDLRNGKSLKYSTDFVPEGLTSFDDGTSSSSLHGSRSLIFGRWDNSVSGALIGWKNLVLSDVRNWGIMNGNGKVICVCACVNSSISMNKDIELKPPPLITMNSSTSTLFKSSKNGNSSSNTLISSHNLLTKIGTVGAFSADESGLICGWDIRNGDCLFKYQIESSDESMRRISKFQSDGKTAVILVTESMHIFLLKGVFEHLRSPEINVELIKIGEVDYTLSGEMSINLFVDYGNKTVVCWNSESLIIFSYDEENNDLPLNHNSNSFPQLVYRPQNSSISQVVFESNDKMFIPRKCDIIGTDPLLAAVCNKYGHIEIINVRESLLSDEIKPINLKTIIPKFLDEPDYMNTLASRINPVASISINSLFIAIANHYGKVEIFDLMTGEYLRTVIDRISKKKLQDLEAALPNQFFHTIVKVFIDESITRGLLIIGNYAQYFLCGNSKHADITSNGNKKKIKSNKRLNDKKGNFNSQIKQTLDIYESEKRELKRHNDLINKYNGLVNDSDDENDQLNMALVMSMSLNESRNDLNNSKDLDEATSNDEEMQQLKRALELSLEASSTDQVVEDQEISNNEIDNEMDEDLKLAIEISRQENYKVWQDEKFSDDDEQWEGLIH
jgi:hypothetical protein